MKNNSKFIQNILNNVKIDIFTKKISNWNELEVKVGTNGYHGGDGGHGSATYISIKDAGNTSMEIQTLKDSDKKSYVAKSEHFCQKSFLKFCFKTCFFLANKFQQFLLTSNVCTSIII